MSDSNQKNLNAQRTRRNIMKAGGVLGSAFLANLVTPKSAKALVCFLKGTKIRTASGDRKVEDLMIGDLLPTVSGEMRPIQWVARYSYKKSDPAKEWVKAARPVRIARSAIDHNVPHADLYVTTGHALFIDGVLVPAGSLINDTTITLHDAREFDELEYFHIKLESHDVIFAEGAPCETLLAVKENARNFADYYRMYGVPKADERSCAPLLGINGGRSAFKFLIRSALAPWVDRRNTLDVIQDRLEERGIALSRQTALTS